MSSDNKANLTVNYQSLATDTDTDKKSFEIKRVIIDNKIYFISIAPHPMTIKVNAHVQDGGPLNVFSGNQLNVLPQEVKDLVPENISLNVKRGEVSTAFTLDNADYLILNDYAVSAQVMTGVFFNDLGMPIDVTCNAVNGNISFSEKVTGSGILKYTAQYEIRHHRTTLLLNELDYPLYWIFYDEQDLSNSKIEVLEEWFPEGEEPQPGPVDVTLRIIEFSSEVPVEGALVEVGGESWGVTDENGEVFKEQVEPGTYSLKITKLGYLDSDEDQISNDEIKVE